jgi:sulfoxide reductase catalytic subunit YedY
MMQVNAKLALNSQTMEGIMNKRFKPDLTENDVTDYALYKSRRGFIKTGVAAGLGLLGLQMQNAQAINLPLGKDDKQNTYEEITSYNNFYEFGTSKSDPAENAYTLKPSPWDVVVDGACAKPGKYSLEDILKPHGIEERIYRLRCVEGWSMVIPWNGFQLGDLLQRFEPTSKAKYVRFETLHDPEQMPGQRRPILKWPYVEGLRMDEAMNELAFIATGLYGKELPNQNGAPLRLVVPWKYGFKNIKSIARISFEEKEPVSSWMEAIPDEYGFYANVNPNVSHPRWSQKRERRIGEWKKRETLMFNGYGEQVASLYKGMDLAKYY